MIPQATSRRVDLPFLPPPDAVLDLPLPPSVNIARKIDHKGKRAVGAWKVQADKRLTLNSGYRKARTALGGKPAEKYELHIRVNESATGCDLANLEKITTDYLVSRELLKNDAKANLRKLVMEWTDEAGAPAGIRVIIKPIEGA